jgi:hypothetical protein
MGGALPGSSTFFTGLVLERAAVILVQPRVRFPDRHLEGSAKVHCTRSGTSLMVNGGDGAFPVFFPQLASSRLQEENGECSPFLWQTRLRQSVYV